jgi:23S rRNA (adenine2030-N6)-methyltransferase
MNYRHAFHAGSFADVLKHATLARILVHLGEKPAPFRVLDTHAGSGLYDLAGEEAARTGEWRLGVGRLMDAALAPDLRRLLTPYLDAIGTLNGGAAPRRYPGSPVLALALMRAQDRLVACELEPQAHAALVCALRADDRARAVAIDGWVALNAYVPPKERRGVVVVDPPFEQRGEFDRMADAVTAAHRKWATGTFLMWYPIKDRSDAGNFAQRLRLSGMPKILRAELSVGEPTEGLTAAGLAVVNPPWRLEGELRILLDGLVPLLARGPGAGATLGWIVGEK